MRLNSVFAAIALLIASTASALALESRLTVSSPLSPNDLWKKVGDFCGMTAWHPLVQTCFLSDDGKQRTVVFFGGIGKAVGMLDDWNDANRSYTFTNVWTFTNVSGLMPIANYHATVSVTENANGTSLNMTATYDAKRRGGRRRQESPR